MHELRRSAHTFLAVCFALGFTAFGGLVVGWFLFGPDRPISTHDLLLAAALAILSAIGQLFVVKRIDGHRSDYLTSAPLFAALLLLPPPLLALVVCVSFVPEWLIYRFRWYLHTFNIASWLVSLTVGRFVINQLADGSYVGSGVPLPATVILATIPAVLAVQMLLHATMFRLAWGLSFRSSGFLSPSKILVETALFCCGWGLAATWMLEPLYSVAVLVPMLLIFQALHVPNLLEQATTDPKTGLANTRLFNSALLREFERAKRTQRPISLLMCDLDYLRNINNTYGHQMGDLVLRRVADLMRLNIRAGDTAARFGGEEFVILLSDTTKPIARQVADRVRQQLAETRFELGPDGRSFSATLSIGVATYPVDADSPDRLVREADLAAYQAKREGRDRVVLAGRASRELAAEWAREYLLPGLDDRAADSQVPFWQRISEVTGIPALVHADLPDRGNQRALEVRQRGAHDRARSVEHFSTAAISFARVHFFVALAALAYTMLSWPTPLPVPWAALVLLGLLAVIAERFDVTLDGKERLSASAVPILGAGFLAGGVGVLVVATLVCGWLIATARPSRHRLVFTFANVTLACSVATIVFRSLAPGVTDIVRVDQSAIGAVIAGLTYFIVFHLPLSVFHRLVDGRASWQHWLPTYRWLWVQYGVFGVFALVVTVAYDVFGWTGIVALAAPVMLMQAAIRSNLVRSRLLVAELEEMNERLRESYEATLVALSHALDTRDSATEQHAQRVRRYTALIGSYLGIPDDELDAVCRGALLHDIGMIGVPDAILSKRGSLTEEEQREMRRHPEIGYSMISHIPLLRQAAEIVLHHHEAYDGSGYPSGLAGQQIPLGARIFAVADALDAMTSSRPYRDALPLPTALTEIARCRGTQFDPQVVDALLSIPVEEIIACSNDEHSTTFARPSHPIDATQDRDRARMLA